MPESEGSLQSWIKAAVCRVRIGTLLMSLIAAQGGPAARPVRADQPGGAPASAVLLLRADRQAVDVDQGRLVATGTVEARFDGWRLQADRLEVMEASRTVVASGRVRLQRGDQTLQASRLRYSQLEGSGELEDVYGVIDREGIEAELQRLQPSGTARLPVQGPPAAATETSFPAPPAAPVAAQPAPQPVEEGFACPPLRNQPGARPLLMLLPPRRTALPSLPAPRSCPGGERSQRPRSLRELLTDVALEPGAAPEGAGAALAGAPPSGTSQAAPIPQRVERVRFRQSVDTGIKLDLAAVIDTDEEASDAGPSGAAVIRRPRPGRGELNRLRFQAANLTVRGNRWSSPQVAFTNDPFTPAQSWIIGEQVEALLEPEGVTRIQARRTRILLSNRLALPGVNRASIGEDGPRLSLDTDQRDRDGIYLGYNLPPLPLGEKGRLELQPQFLVQRAVQGRTDSYTAPGRSLAGPRVNQDLQGGDLFGLLAVLNAPLGRFSLKADTSFSTFSPDNFAAGTRSIVRLGTPLGLSAHSRSQGQLFGAYRERVYNGSLGLQTVVYAYGGQLEGNLTLNPDPADRAGDPRRTPYFGPWNVDWRAVVGDYQAALYRSEDLDTLWRARINAGINGSLRLWEAPPDPERETLAALRYSAVPIRPGVALDFGLASSLARYEDGARQNTLTLFGGPAFTLGRFRQPWFDYTQLALLVGGTLRDGRSPFGFDRAVDLRTVSFRAAQQLYGPLVLEAGATVNIDDSSRFYGDVSYSYLELKLQQRSYELGVYYSPYDGIGGIRIKLNDFTFGGGGTPFVPRPVHDAQPEQNADQQQILNRRSGSL
jgi:hypothetical protein